MIKHFGRWVVALMLALIAAAWFIERTVSAATITRALWIVYVATPVAALFILERRRGARPGVLTLVAPRRRIDDPGATMEDSAR